MITYNALSTLTSASILALRSPARLFPENIQGMGFYRRKLLQLWHPDTNKDPQATDVFHHVTDLYNRGMTQLEQNTWEFEHKHSVELTTGPYSFDYFRKEAVNGFADMYVSKNSIYYVCPAANGDMVSLWERNSKRFLKGLVGNAEAKKVFTPFLTSLPIFKGIVGGETLVEVKKDPGYLCLKHVQKIQPLDAKHVVWIISRLLNMASMFEAQSTPNLDICMRSVFINPELHTVFLADGWQYCASFPEKVVALPVRTSGLCPSIKATFKTTPSDMTVQIKALGRELLGDPLGLTYKKPVPDALCKWLLAPTQKTCIEDFKLWDKLKPAFFGKPVFTKLEVKDIDIY